MSSERGAVLLEVLVALTILTVAGLSLVGLLSAGVRAEQDALRRERVLADEERVLAAMTLLTRGDLDRRLGRHDVGEFVVNVQRPERTLYRIVIGQRSSAHVEDLVTVVFRRAGEGP